MKEIKFTLKEAQGIESTFPSWTLIEWNGEHGTCVFVKANARMTRRINGSWIITIRVSADELYIGDEATTPGDCIQQTFNALKSLENRYHDMAATLTKSPRYLGDNGDGL